MNRAIGRRDLMKSACAAGALVSLAGAELFAAAQNQFVPLQLNAQGRGLVNRRVSALDAHEDAMLEDLLGGGTQAALHRDVQALDQDLGGILADPGIPGGYDPNAFRQEGGQLHQQLYGYMPPGMMLGMTQVTVIIRQVDGFVGHWYPCNDILEVGACQRKVWNNFGSGNWRAIEVYLDHMSYEMDFMFRYHARGGPFAQHCGALMGRLRHCRGLVRQDLTACRSEFMVITSATDLVYRKYYPEYC